MYKFCGNEPEVILAAAKHVEDSCDAVDINLGCPQGIARKGHYGAFLLTEYDLLQRIVSTVSFCMIYLYNHIIYLYIY
jgi:tRNA-dihydrouridine synthase 1